MGLIFEIGISQNIKCENSVGFPKSGHICASYNSCNSVRSQWVLGEQDQWVLVDHNQGLLALPGHNQQALMKCYHQETLHKDNQMAIMMGTNILFV